MLVDFGGRVCAARLCRLCALAVKVGRNLAPLGPIRSANNVICIQFAGLGSGSGAEDA